MRTTAKNNKLSICLKLDVLRKLKNGMKVMEVATSLDLSDGTVRKINRKLKNVTTAFRLDSEKKQVAG